MAKKFNQFIGEYRSGVLNEILSDEFQKLTNDVICNNKKGSLTLNIDITPKSDGTAMVKVKHTVKEPKIDTMESIMFYTPEGDLLNNDPNQHDMFKGAKNVDEEDKKGNVKVV